MKRNLDEMKIMHLKANNYLKKGYSVIPIVPYGKKPLVEWTKYQNSRPSANKFRAWWRQWPEANMAVVTGPISGIFVIDVDGKEGEESLKKLEKLYSPLPETYTVKTPRGYHLYFKWSDGYNVKSSSGTLGKKIDVRGIGGYVLIPPSMNTEGTRYRGLSSQAPQAAPQWLLDLLTKPPSNENRKAKEDWVSHLLAEGADEGCRDDSATRLAGYFARCKQPQDITLEMLKTWNESKNKPPLPDKDIEKVVNSIYNRRGGEGFSHASKPSTFRLQTLTDYMLEYSDTEVNWLVDGWLPKSTVGFMVSPPGSYKTWMLLDLAVSVASGTPLFGLYPVNESGPVMIIQQEDWHGQTAERLNVILTSRFGCSINLLEGGSIEIVTLPELPIYLHPDRQLRFGSSDIMDLLEAQIAEIRPKLILIDPLYSAASTENYMANTAEKMLRLKELRDRYGCSFMIAHHTKKGFGQSAEGEQGSDREGLWGSQFLNALLETGWQIRTTPKEAIIKVRRHFKMAKNKEETYLSFDIKTEGEDYTYSVQESTSIIFTDDKDDILEALRDGPKTHGELAEATGIKNATLSRRLKTLVEQGEITKQADKKYYLKEVD